jgi:hypothetical protein
MQCRLAIGFEADLQAPFGKRQTELSFQPMPRSILSFPAPLIA